MVALVRQDIPAGMGAAYLCSATPVSLPVITEIAYRRAIDATGTTIVVTGRMNEIAVNPFAGTISAVHMEGATAAPAPVVTGA